MSSPQPQIRNSTSLSPPPYTTTATKGSESVLLRAGDNLDIQDIGDIGGPVKRSPSPAKRRASVMEKDHAVELNQGERHGIS